MSILVTGANGQIGKALQNKTKENNESFIYCTRRQLDITQAASIEHAIAYHQPHTIINTAAYTAVDLAESEQEQAHAINHYGVEKLAQICDKHHVRLIHLSTDYIFDGTKKLPYQESDEPNPINQYGLSKLRGEQSIQQYHANYIILRLSGIFSAYGNNFLKTILKLAESKSVLNIISDQVTGPTYAEDIAVILIHMANQNLQTSQQEIYHYCNTPAVSWYEFAKTILQHAKKLSKITLNPISSIAYSQAATRPAYSFLDCHKIQSAFNFELNSWDSGMKQTLNQLATRTIS